MYCIVRFKRPIDTTRYNQHIQRVILPNTLSHINDMKFILKNEGSLSKMSMFVHRHSRVSMATDVAKLKTTAFVSTVDHHRQSKNIGNR